MRPFRQLSKPFMIVRGTYVKSASVAISTVDDYHKLPNLTKREDLRVGDEVYIQDIIGDVRRPKIDEVTGDEARASDDGLVFLLEFNKVWSCPNTVQREVWEKGARR